MKRYFILICLLCALGQIWAARKAMIIGNGDYKNNPLKNAVNDARLMEKTIKKVGFDPVLLINKDSIELERAIKQFAAKIDSSDEVFFYYSGHAVQLQNTNYLIPVREDITDDTSVKRRGISLSEDVMERLDRAKFLIIVMDACRDNPFGGVRGGTRGLAIPPTNEKSHYILYSTAANDVAQDGIGENSDFTRILCDNIVTPGLELLALGKKIGQEVFDLNYGQRPEQFVRFYHDYYFIPPTPETDIPVVVFEPVVQAPQPPTPPVGVQPPAPDVNIPKVTTPPAVALPKSDATKPQISETEIAILNAPRISDTDNTPSPTPKHEVLQVDGAKKHSTSYSFGSLTEAKLSGFDMLRTNNYAQFQYRKLWFRQSFDALYKKKNYPLWKFNIGIPLYIADLDVGFMNGYAPFTDYFEVTISKSFKISNIWMTIEGGGNNSHIKNTRYTYDTYNRYRLFYLSEAYDDISKTQNKYTIYFVNGHREAQEARIQCFVTNMISPVPHADSKYSLRNSIPLYSQKQDSFFLNITGNMYPRGDVKRESISGDLSYKLNDATEIDISLNQTIVFNFVSSSDFAPLYYQYSGFLSANRASHTFDLAEQIRLTPCLGVFYHNYEEWLEDNYSDDYAKRTTWSFPLELNAHYTPHPNLSLDAKLGWRIGDIMKPNYLIKSDPLIFSLAFSWQYSKSFDFAKAVSRTK